MTPRLKAENPWKPYTNTNTIIISVQKNRRILQTHTHRHKPEINNYMKIMIIIMMMIMYSCYRKKKTTNLVDDWIHPMLYIKQTKRIYNHNLDDINKKQSIRRVEINLRFSAIFVVALFFGISKCDWISIWFIQLILKCKGGVQNELLNVD